MDALKVYWRQGCSNCVKVKEYLAGLGVEFESIDVGLQPQAMADLTSIYNAVPRVGVTSSAHVRAYGNGIARRLQAWWAALPDKSCRQTVTTYYGERPLHELLKRCTWHSAQHARQIIAVLGGLGIAAEPPLTGDDYAGLPMTAGLWS